MPSSETRRQRRCLITGTAGFIGFHVARRLLANGHLIDGIDGMTPYYDVKLKHQRHAILARSNAFRAHEVMLEDSEAIDRIAGEAKPDVIIHLAAQAGVRYSLEQPRAYVDANLVGTFNVMEIARRYAPDHFLLASTSSVYGANTSMPFREIDRTDHPITLYAATKKATEDMAHSYAHLWQIPTTAFRFFTVYGPWGRPDMALFKFVKAGLAGEPLDVYGHGEMRRDFTYIDDLVEAIVRLIDCAPVAGQPIAEFDSLSPAAPYRVVNIAGGQPVGLMPFIDAIEASLDRPLLRNMLPMQKGDVQATFAAPDLLERLTGYLPATPVATGIERFVEWYLATYAK
ncbi:NAD-dependent epimerase/dehydratase family protein [Mesorhizobium sp. BR1-1-16]|uniref:NAD-dependent epimerase/dehydratase family protein n=1 Tax=Mesorhizobium sp. BR1-1-16 TaxID=2876653 RepID=UPI001CCB2BAC|nr:NAD-dependent epimerase/dehydratase family protein [Mesorhizobium sp. BR1-1-16]MBZ9937875.1 NAD-dependent epimerase/dehydratase family protein [Mesorhizobium sp. BR1-1-16]